MISFIEPLYKSASKITFGWNKEPGVDVLSYSIYVGSVPGTLTLLAGNISARPSVDPSNYKKVTYDVQVADVQTLLGLTADFSTLVLYWAITYTDISGESPFSGSLVVEIPPVGIASKLQKEDPTINRHIFGFSSDLQRWIKSAASSSGAVIVSTSDFYADNITTQYSYNGDVTTALSYPSDRTTSGSPAKLTTYTYSGGNLAQKAVSDSTVP